MEETLCLLCNSGKSRKVFEGIDYLHGFSGKFKIVKCSSCGFIYTNPRPNKKDILNYYPNNYKPHLDSSRRVVTVKNLKKKWYYNGSKDIPNLIPGKILDIGCSSGSFLFDMKNLGWDVSGIEPSLDSTIIANKSELNVINASFEDHIIEKSLYDYYDLITAWMVIEHLHNPKQSFEKIYKLLKKDAYFVFSIPEVSSWEFNFFKDKWYATQLPTHLSFFTKKTIKKTLEENNFIVEKIYFHSNLKNLFNTLIMISDEKKYYNISKILKKLSFKRNSIFMKILGIFYGFLSQSGRITVWAKKI